MLILQQQIIFTFLWHVVCDKGALQQGSSVGLYATKGALLNY
jgi:hypothetical protein